MDPNSPVPAARRCELLQIPRSSYYYRPKARKRGLDGDAREEAMHAIDGIHPEMPYLGARKIARGLGRRTGGGIDAGRKAAASLMAEMDVRPVYPEQSLSKPAKGSKRHPHLLKNKAMRFPDQAWSADIAYVPVGRPHMYSTCVIDWLSRYIVGWRLADGMAAPGVAACMRDAFDERGEPAIVDSDQGSAFNSAQHEGLPKGRSAVQGMDGKARWVDNVIIERWFGSLKSEWPRADEHSTPLELRRLVARYVDQCNSTRPRESLGHETPESWHHSGLTAA